MICRDFEKKKVTDNVTAPRELGRRRGHARWGDAYQILCNLPSPRSLVSMADENGTRHPPGTNPSQAVLPFFAFLRERIADSSEP
jgi:hypothetical protein